MGALQGKALGIMAAASVWATVAAGQTTAIGCTARTEPCTPLARRIQALVSGPAVARAHWGVMAVNMDGSPIYALNEGQFFQPASNAKLFTTAAAIALLGPDMISETRVVGRGVFTGRDHLSGDVVLLGGGEPNLSGRALPYRAPKHEADRSKADVPEPKPDPLRYLEAMADEVVATGLKVVEGDVVGDDTFFASEPYPSDWAIDDMVWGYGAPISALSINDNQMEVTVTAGTTPGLRNGSVTVNPALPAYYTIDASQLVTGAASVGNQVQMERAPGSKVLRVYGGIGVTTPPDVEEIATPDPAEFGAIALKAMLEARGVRVTGVARAEHAVPSMAMGFRESSRELGDVVGRKLLAGELTCTGEMSPGLGGSAPETVLARHRSEPLRDDIVVTNKVSQNLHAELLLHHLARKVACGTSTADGAGVIRGFLTGLVGIDGEDFVFYDGSGLSGHDLVTPRATVRLLTWASGQPWFSAWKSSLPVGGVDGSLLNRFTREPLKGRVFAKTGTLGEARALSGYLVGASGRTVAFSVMVTDHAPGGHADQDAMDAIVEAIAAAS